MNEPVSADIRIDTIDAVAEPSEHYRRVWPDDVARAYLRAVERADVASAVVRVELRIFAVRDEPEE